MLGEGTSGKTYLAKRNSDDLQVAVKVMKFALAENYKSYELFCREAEVMKSLNIPGVPRVFE
jgi:serine/threonine protein kinase